MKEIHHGQNIKEIVGFANSLRRYCPEENEKTLKILKKELKKQKKIEATTPDNKKLDAAQDEITRLEKEIRHVSKDTIDGYRTAYQKLSEKFSGFTMYCEGDDKIVLQYNGGGFKAESRIVRKDAEKLFDNLIEANQ